MLHTPSPFTDSFTRRWRAPLLALMLLLALTASCVPPTSPAGPAPPTAAPAPKPTPREPLTLTLLHTNDTWGYLSPCG